jgi:hypothetical protein
VIKKVPSGGKLLRWLSHKSDPVQYELYPTDPYHIIQHAGVVNDPIFKSSLKNDLF